MKLRSVYLVTLASLVLVAFAVRAISIDIQSLWRDEVDAMLFATAPLDEVLFHFTQPRWNGPLYFLLLRGWILLSGTSEYAMRFFSLIFGVLCVPLMYVLGRRLFNRQTGIIAALLMAVSPYFTWYGQEVKMYTLVPALALLAIYALRRALSEPEGRAVWYWWVVQVAATSLAFYAHILAAMLIPVQVLLFFTWWPQARRRWRGALIALACLTLPYLPLAEWEVPLLLDDRVTNFSHQSFGETVETLLAIWREGNFFLLRARETGFGHFTLPVIVGTLLDHWSLGYFGDFGWGWPYGTILMCVMAAVGLVGPSTLVFREIDSKRVKRVLSRLGWVLSPLALFPILLLSETKIERARWSGTRSRLALLCWVAAPPLALWYVSQWQPLFTDRYLIWAGLAFYLLIALGLAVIWRAGGGGRWIAAVLISLVLGFSVTNLWQQASQQGKANFRAAAAYVAANYEEVDLDKVVVQPGPHQAACEDCAFRAYMPMALSRYSRFDGLIIFQIPHGRYSFDYYFPYEGYPWADGLYTNHRHPDDSYMMSEKEAAEKMERMTEAYDVVWLVASETEMWDERGLVKGWLDANMRLTDEVGEYLWVDVYLYTR